MQTAFSPAVAARGVPTIRPMANQATHAVLNHAFMKLLSKAERGRDADLLEPRGDDRDAVAVGGVDPEQMHAVSVVHRLDGDAREDLHVRAKGEVDRLVPL